MRKRMIELLIEISYYKDLNKDDEINGAALDRIIEAINSFLYLYKGD